ncbi:MAG: L,D-transpeptidase family protein [Myxococcota bacterium]
MKKDRRLRFLEAASLVGAQLVSACGTPPPPKLTTDDPVAAPSDDDDVGRPAPPGTSLRRRTPDLVERAPKKALEDAAPATSLAHPPREPEMPPEDPALLEDCHAPRTIVVRKGRRELELRCGSAVAARFRAGLGFAPEGHKRREGDGRTPEGTYFVPTKYFSRFHRSMQLSYPNVDDADAGLAAGVITPAEHAAIVRAQGACTLPPQTTALGSWVQLHGGGGTRDWTLGCIAIDDAAIEAAFAFHLPGCRGGVPRTKIVIEP